MVCSSFVALCFFCVFSLPACNAARIRNVARNVDAPGLDCTFDIDLCGWKTGVDDNKAVYGWTRQEGGTPTEGTGPKAGHSGSGYYMYTEASSPLNPHYKFILESPVFPKGSYASFTFWYHMRGINIQELMVDYANDEAVWQSDPGEAIKLWMQVGDQGDQWHQAHVNIPSTARRLRFYAMMPNGNYGDVAVDDVEFHVDPAPEDEKEETVESGKVSGRATLDAITGDKILFGDGEKIVIMNFDGSDATNLVDTAAGCPHIWGTVYDPRSRLKEVKTAFGAPQHMAFDKENGLLFWADWAGASAYRNSFNATLFAAPITGGNVEPIVTSGFHHPPPGFPKGIPGCGKPIEATWACPPSDIHPPVGDLPITHMWSPLGVAPDPKTEMLYFTDDDTRVDAVPQIQRVSYDGRKVPAETVIIEGITGRLGAVNVDPRRHERMIYWVEQGIKALDTGFNATSSCEIRRIRIPGEDPVGDESLLEDEDDEDEEDGQMDNEDDQALTLKRNKRAVSYTVLASYVSGGVSGFVLDLDYERFYWADETGPKIQRCPLSGCPKHASGIGSQPELVVQIYDPAETDSEKPRIKGIAVDGAASKIYWAEDHAAHYDRWRQGGYIKSANLDGTDIRELHRAKGVPFGLAIYRQVPVTVTPEPATPAPTAAPSFAPQPWGQVTQGDCRLDRDSGCLTSPNFPDRYARLAKCTIKTEFGKAPNLEAVVWDMPKTGSRRRTDTVNFGGSKKYSGAEPPPPAGVEPAFSITFATAYTTSGGSFKFCPIAPAAAETTTTAASSAANAKWEVTSGHCKLDSDGCALSPNYPDAFPVNQECIIEPLDGKMILFDLKAWDMGDDDSLKMDEGMEYSGSYKPMSGFMQKKLTFKSGETDGTNTGFKVCVTMALR